MMSEKNGANTEFEGLVRDVPVGQLYEKATIGDRIVRKGDIVAHDDRDIREEEFEAGIHSRLFIGVVEGILDPKHQDEPQVFATTPIGKLDISDVNISGEGSLIPPESGHQKFVEQFLNSDYEKYMTCEWGNDIDGTGEDFRRRGE